MSKEDAANPQVAALGPIPSEDGTAVLFNVVLTDDTDKTATIVDGLNSIRDSVSTGGTTMYMLGEPTSTDDFKKISEEDLRKGEAMGVAVAIIVLIAVFAALLAGVTPIVLGIFAISIALGVVGLIGTFWRFSFFAPNLISMMGLAVGIDYSLFIVSRYREERQRGRDKLEAIGRSGATANRAVFFSGLTVVLALAGMLLVPTTIFRALAGGAIIVVLISVALSMTLLPALLSLLRHASRADVRPDQLAVEVDRREHPGAPAHRRGRGYRHGYPLRARRPGVGRRAPGGRPRGRLHRCAHEGDQARRVVGLVALACGAERSTDVPAGSGTASPAP